jgi:hypothetical protein
MEVVATDVNYLDVSSMYSGQMLGREVLAGANTEVIDISEIYKAFVSDYFVYEDQHLLYLIKL